MVPYRQMQNLRPPDLSFARQNANQNLRSSRAKPKTPAAAAGTSYRYITICTVQYGTVLYTLDDKYVSSVSETESETQCFCVSGNQLVFLENIK